MSAFLGPIHYWVYNKIQIQQSIVEEIVTLGETVLPDLKERLINKYGDTETRPLEEVIDTGNIHGWLQENVSRVEYKLADSVTSILKIEPELFEKIKTIFREKGEEKSIEISKNSPKDAYKVISDSLLDGMPCDHAYSVLEENDELVKFKRNVCVHENYWNDINGDITNYYKLRDEFINGCLKGTNLSYVKVDEDSNMIKRSDANE